MPFFFFFLFFINRPQCLRHHNKTQIGSIETELVFVLFLTWSRRVGGQMRVNQE